MVAEAQNDLQQDNNRYPNNFSYQDQFSFVGGKLTSDKITIQKLISQEHEKKRDIKADIKYLTKKNKKIKKQIAELQATFNTNEQNMYGKKQDLFYLNTNIVFINQNKKEIECMYNRAILQTTDEIAEKLTYNHPLVFKDKGEAFDAIEPNIVRQMRDQGETFKQECEGSEDEQEKRDDPRKEDSGDDLDDNDSDEERDKVEDQNQNEDYPKIRLITNDKESKINSHINTETTAASDNDLGLNKEDQ